MQDIGFSVLMPTYNQCTFIRRAIRSLYHQSYKKWELIIINDGCTDETEEYIDEFLHNDHVKYIKNKKNMGLGYALNQGLDAACYDYIAYLPSDDFYYENHLSTLAKELSKENVILAYSGVRWDNCDSLHGSRQIESMNTRPGFSMQLVQVVHKKVQARWTERTEWISDDLFLMFWNKILTFGIFCTTAIVSCFWTSHPWQRHKIINEKFGGGINKIRSYYKIKTPLKVKVSKEKFIDEEKLYYKFRSKCKQQNLPLKVLLVGELAYNPQRIYALEQAGCKLYGLWVPYPNLSFSTVGPLPFANVEDVPFASWKKTVEIIKPDIIYAMLNWGAIDWAYEVILSFPQIPFAWHYKEGPYVAMGAGNWDKLIYLYRHADLKIYLNSITKEFYEQFIPKGDLSLLLDGDLPKQDYFKECFSKKLSTSDGEIHTVCAGRLIGLDANHLEILASNHIHVHLYLENYHASRAKILEYYKRKFPKYFHIHDHCSPDNWTKEFSKYDAGWLHCIESHNEGSIMRATWDDLNFPARISTYAAAGIPMICPSNINNVVAIKQVLECYDIGIMFENLQDLAHKLKDKVLMSKKNKNILVHRLRFSFDYHVPELLNKFQLAIKKKNEQS